MITLTLSDILDDVRAAEEGLHKFERRYWISSDDFFKLYSLGQLDDGENAEEFAEWAGHYKLRQKRQAATAPGGGFGGDRRAAGGICDGLGC